MSTKNNRPHLVEGNKYIVALKSKSNSFVSFDEALKFADLLTSYIKRIAKKNNHHCVGIIGVAHHAVEIEAWVLNEETRKRELLCNRPEFKGEKKHCVYILLVANPDSNFKNDIYGYFRKKGKMIEEVKIIKNYGDTIRNVIIQLLKIKTVNLFSEELNPWAYDFIRIATQSNHDVGNMNRLFTGYDSDNTGRLFVLKGKKVIFEGFPSIAEYTDEWKDLTYEEPKVVFKKVDLWADYE